MKDVRKETTEAINGNMIIDQSTYGQVDKFEIVSEFPVGYVLWNIGRHNFQHERYIPLARPSEVPYHIKRDSLKALKVESEELALFLFKKAHKVEINYSNFEQIVKDFNKSRG